MEPSEKIVNVFPYKGYQIQQVEFPEIYVGAVTDDELEPLPMGEQWRVYQGSKLIEKTISEEAAKDIVDMLIEETE